MYVMKNKKMIKTEIILIEDMNLRITIDIKLKLEVRVLRFNN